MDSLIIHIPDELFASAESSFFQGTYSLSTFKVGVDEYRIEKPVDYSVLVTNVGGAFLVTGTVEADAVTSCVRCLEDAPYHLTGVLEDYFVIPGADAEITQDEEAEFEILNEEHTIDLASLFIAALVLEAPLMPLCAEECKGLCSQCGTNLNSNPCTCTAEEDDTSNPFAVLKTLNLEK